MTSDRVPALCRGPLVSGSGRRLAAAALAALCLTIPAMAAPAGSPTTAPAGLSDGRHTPFVTVLYQHWAAWDADHDGTLSAEEVDRAVADPAVTGDAAAAAASLKMVSRGKAAKSLPPLTRAYFDGYNAVALPLVGHENPDTAARAADGTIDAARTPGLRERIKALPADWDLYFNSGRRQIARNSTGPAWHADVAPADLAHMRQGPLGDCFLVASIGSLASHRPQGVRDLVHQDADGSYTVTFHNAAPVHVPAITDAQRAIGSSTAGQGAWLVVLEEAYGKAKSVEQGGSADVDGTDVVRVGGDSKNAIAMLTGHKVDRVSMARTAAERATQKQRVLAELRPKLLAAIAAHREITAGIDPPRTRAGADVAAADLPKIPPNFPIHHVYAVINYDPKTDTVQIWNPHGQTYHPKGPDGLANGYTTEHGLFQLPLADAYTFYTSFTIEQDAPATRPSLTRADP